MRSHHHTLLRSAALAVLFTALFHGTGIGLNLLLFEVVAIAALLLTHRPEATSWLLLSVAGTLCTAVAVVWHGSQLAIAVNLISGTVLLGSVLAPRLGAPHRAVLLAMAQAGRAHRTRGAAASAVGPARCEAHAFEHVQGPFQETLLWYGGSGLRRGPAALRR